MVQRLRDAALATDASLCYPGRKAVIQNKGGDTPSLSKLDGPNPRVGWVGVHTKSHSKKLVINLIALGGEPKDPNSTTWE